MNGEIINHDHRGLEEALQKLKLGIGQGNHSQVFQCDHIAPMEQTSLKN